MQFEVKFYERGNFSKEYQDFIMACLRGEVSSSFNFSGRSGFFEVPEKFREFGAELLKMKGLGFFDAQTRTTSPPGEKLYFGGEVENEQGIKELANRLVVEENGDFAFREFEIKPFGGQFFERAALEYEVLVRLFDVGKKVAMQPIAVAKILDKKFAGKELGVSVFGISNRDFSLLEEYFIFKRQNGLMALSKRFHPATPSDEVFVILSDLLMNLGSNLAALHENFVSIEGHLANCTVLGKAKKVLLHDLDNAIAVETLQPTQLFNYKIRDLASYFSAILTNILFGDLLFLSGDLVINDENVFNFNLLKSFMEGYESVLPSALEDELDFYWKDTIDFYYEKIADTPEKERLVLLHPFVTGKKIDALFSFYKLPCGDQVKSAYTEQSHALNIKTLLENSASGI